MVTILGISGSPRKSATEYCVKEALKAAEEIKGVSTEFIALRGKRINGCIHCDRCLREEKLYCPAHDDDMKELYDYFVKADGYIIGSPVYQMVMSSQLQAFLNRLRPLWPYIKDGYLFSKVGGAIAVGGTRHGGEETTLLAINNFYNCFGIIPVSGGPWAYNGAAVWSQDRREEGAREDLVGMETVRVIGRRVAQVATWIKYGKERADAEGIPVNIRSVGD
ncbi:MAG TPA: flavodoxin family protein [Clostridia bacterium]|nr:flavodoxin family protein [Clostridia bacterium]